MYQDDIESKCFHGRSGRAFLVNSVANVKLGPKENRMLLTGLHTVQDVSCKNCGVAIGWRYDAASNPAQKWKVSKFTIEKAYLHHET